MAERLKRRWFKFMAVFCSLYLAPLSNLFTKVFAFVKPADALAVTVTCTASLSVQDSTNLDCAGDYAAWAEGATIKPSDGDDAIVECVCPTDVSKVLKYTCTHDSDSTAMWLAASSCTEPSNPTTCGTGQIAVAGKCYPTCIENPANGIGYVATEPAF